MARVFLFLDMLSRLHFYVIEGFFICMHECIKRMQKALEVTNWLEMSSMRRPARLLQLLLQFLEVLGPMTTAFFSLILSAQQRGHTTSSDYHEILKINANMIWLASQGLARCWLELPFSIREELVSVPGAAFLLVYFYDKVRFYDRWKTLYLARESVQ